VCTVWINRDLWSATCEPWPVTRDLWPATCDPWPATCDPWPVTCDPWPVTRDPWPVTRDPWPVTRDLWNRPAASLRPWPFERVTSFSTELIRAEKELLFTKFVNVNKWAYRTLLCSISNPTTEHDFKSEQFVAVRGESDMVDLFTHELLQLWFSCMNY
jgi:hypothetical protein